MDYIRYFHYSCTSNYFKNQIVSLKSSVSSFVSMKVIREPLIFRQFFHLQNGLKTYFEIKTACAVFKTNSRVRMDSSGAGTLFRTPLAQFWLIVNKFILGYLAKMGADLVPFAEDESLYY